MISPIETANWPTTSALRSRPEPSASARRLVGLEHPRGLEARQIEGRIETAEAADEEDEQHGREQDAVRAEIGDRHVGIEEGVDEGQQQPRPGPARSASPAPTSSMDSPRNCAISCRREAPSTLRSATSRARWPARAVARLTKLTTAMARISSADQRHRRDRRAVVAGPHRAALRLAEMDVADVDQPPVDIRRRDWSARRRASDRGCCAAPRPASGGRSRRRRRRAASRA